MIHRCYAGIKGYLSSRTPPTPYIQTSACVTKKQLPSPHSVDDQRAGHDDAEDADVGTESFAYPRAFPEYARHAVFVPVHGPGEHRVHVRRRADDQQYDEEEGLKIEDRGHDEVLFARASAKLGKMRVRPIDFSRAQMRGPACVCDFNLGVKRIQI